MHTPTRDPEPFQPVALVLAILFPGAGHLYLGYARRAALIAAGVLGLFAGGLLIGGIDVVDREEDKIWFLPQALVGPVAFGVDWAHQNWFKAYDPSSLAGARTLAEARRRSARPGEARVVEEVALASGPGGVPTRARVPVFRPAPAGQGPPSTKSVGRANELGTLYGAIAGMLNLICVIDAAAKVRARPGGGGR